MNYMKNILVGGIMNKTNTNRLVALKSEIEEAEVNTKALEIVLTSLKKELKGKGLTNLKDAKNELLRLSEEQDTLTAQISDKLDKIEAQLEGE